MDTFELITWPDIQAYMPIKGFEENACLANDEFFIKNYGSSAYFVSIDWLKSLELDDKVKLTENMQK